MGVVSGRTAVALGPTGLAGRWAGVHESSLIGDDRDCCDRSRRYHESWQVGMVTDDSGGHKNATR